LLTSALDCDRFNEQNAAMEARQADLDGSAKGCHRASFKETSWWVVSQAARPETPAAEGARQSFCKAYWWPVFFYLRRHGHTQENSEDLTQGFLARVLEKNYLQSASREKGKLRSFLLVMLKRFLGLHGVEWVNLGGGGQFQAL
jgi:hypothetical protein